MLVDESYLLPANTIDQLAQACTRLTHVPLLAQAGFEISLINRNHIQQKLGHISVDYNERTSILSRAIVSERCSVEQVQALLDIGADSQLPGLAMTAVGYLGEASGRRIDDSLTSLLGLFFGKRF